VSEIKDKIKVIFSDITKENTDAIVNAANRNLSNRGGVAKAIRLAAGEDMQLECDQKPRVAIGQATITGGYQLPAKYIIHAVGPVYGIRPDQQAKQLQGAYYNSLRVANEYQLKTISFPAISCGVYKYPVKQAASLAVEGLVKGLIAFPDITEVQICLFNDPRAVDNIKQIFEEALAEFDETETVSAMRPFLDKR
jgi:O-acetyl-ADP-ribose deacetylase (regulator of RNase III)